MPPSELLLRSLLLPLLLAAVLWPAHAHAQVRRCAGQTGEAIYTDRNCTDIGAVDRLMRAPGAGSAPSAYRGGCSRRLNELVYGLSSAIDAKDVNRLALLYDWAGMSTRQGYVVMGRLEGIVRRPLVDILPIYPRPPPVLAEDGTVFDTNADGYFSQTTTRGTPVGLRLEQTFGNGVTPSRTVFGLRKRLGCWWLSL
jgi:hypothetical protein